MICKNKKEISLAEKHLKLRLENLQEKYNLIYNKNEEKEEEINELNVQLEKIKNILLYNKFDKKYIDTEMIIEEVSENKSYSSFFFNNSNRNDSKNFDDSYKEKITTPHKKNKIKFSDNSLKMNINLNINVINPERKLSIQEAKYRKDINTIPKPNNYRAKSSNSLGNFVGKKIKKEFSN